jgi:SWI/SNF-related matrix-associated actin-dependent regulator of chromatin subfamily A member 5
MEDKDNEMVDTEGNDELAADSSWEKLDDAKEIKTYESVKEEQKKRLEELRAAVEDDGDEQEEDEDDAKMRRLNYLMAQTEVFSHFLDGTDTSTTAPSKRTIKGKKSSKGDLRRAGRDSGRTRMAEADEDKALISAAQKRVNMTRLMKQPSNIEGGTMRAYQLEGLNWLIKLHENNINGILADEMGLGKTLQTISLLAYLRESRNINGPHLIIVPKSVVTNWTREFKRWCPSIRCVRLQGTQDERKHVVQEFIKPLKCDAVIASFESVLLEKNHLTKINWKYVIIDEAHRIKNENSSLSQAARLMKADFRLLITGTPLQNNLHELWALLNFLMPDVFDSSESFDAWFNVEDEKAKENVVVRLQSVVRPFMLRRIKNDVETELMPKIETKLYIGMTALQRQWYTRVLMKDVETLNALGGAEKVRLLNVLMQLRKVCNHPYLFEGAEEGPPFIDGPHIWENAGKLSVLNKLLPKLQKQGSRVLIFCQMTRMLDIIEDYIRVKNYKYCRIDGSSKGDERDVAMDEFNAPGSDKFVFLLSTRAGGLGINLQTADTVVLYDSDWNPQVDLQAMDRAHRIGQTKQVRVFRFITEGTVEEKIIERADRKLFLDAAVIQQGRLAASHSNLSRGELMQMVKFGADEIMSGRDGTLTDEDIDILLAKGAERTKSQTATIETEMRHNLANFSVVMEEAKEINLFTFEGENFKGQRKKKENTGESGSFIALPQRERKKSNYDVNEYYKDAMGLSTGSRSDKGQKRVKGAFRPVQMHDFQFWNRKAMESIIEEEEQKRKALAEQVVVIKELRLKEKKCKNPTESATIASEAANLEQEMQCGNFELSEQRAEVKRNLVATAFPEWSKKDFRAFCDALERNGRSAVDDIVLEVSAETGKAPEDVKRYYEVFWKRYTEVEDHVRIVERADKTDRAIAREKQIADTLRNKITNYSDPWRQMTLAYGASKGRLYTDEEDVFLVMMMRRHGYGSWERIRMEIRDAWQFRFDWFIKSRTAPEIMRRCDTLVRLIEREGEDAKDRYERQAMLGAEDGTGAGKGKKGRKRGSTGEGGGGKRSRA